MNIPSTLGAHDTLPQIKALHAHLDDLAAMQAEREAAEQAMETQFLLAASLPAMWSSVAQFGPNTRKQTNGECIADGLFDYEPKLRLLAAQILCALANAGDPVTRQLLRDAAMEYARVNAEGVN